MTPVCINSQVEMKLDERLKGTHTRGFRIRRFVCPVCGYRTTIFGDGFRDLVADPRKAVEEAQKLYPVDKTKANE
jgi:hypothetical protein